MAQQFDPKPMTTARFTAVAINSPSQTATITSHDGVQLRCRLYHPDTSSEPAWKSPVLLIHSPYFQPVIATEGSEFMEQSIVEAIQEHGWTVALVDARGTASSQGCLDVFGVDDAKDFKVVVEWLATQPQSLYGWSMAGKVVAYGHSYSASIPMYGAQLKPAGLAAVIASAGLGDPWAAAYEGGVPSVTSMGVLGSLLIACNAVPSIDESLVTATIEGGPCTVQFSQSAVGNGDKTAYWVARDQLRAKTALGTNVSAVEVPFLLTHGHHDHLVGHRSWSAWYNATKVFKRAILGNWTHCMPDRLNASRAADWLFTVLAFANRFALGLSTGVESWPAVQVQDDAGKWRAQSSLPDLSKSQKLTLSGGQLLDLDLLGLDLGVPTTWFNEALGATWTSAPLKQDTHFSGAPHLDLWMVLDKTSGNVSVKLVAVSPDGLTTRYLSIGACSTRHRNDPSNPTDVIVGSPILVAIDLAIVEANVPAGWRVKLTVSGAATNATEEAAQFITNGYPPAGSGYTASVLQDKTHPSALYLPLAKPSTPLQVPTGYDEFGTVISWTSP